MISRTHLQCDTCRPSASIHFIIQALFVCLFWYLNEQGTFLLASDHLYLGFTQNHVSKTIPIRAQLHCMDGDQRFMLSLHALWPRGGMFASFLMSGMGISGPGSVYMICDPEVGRFPSPLVSGMGINGSGSVYMVCDPGVGHLSL